MARLLLVRHGESEWNAQRRWQGHHDVPLTARGEEQAKHAALHLAQLAGEMGIRRLAASDLSRARRTAEIVANTLGVSAVSLDPRLRERHMGAWTGLTMEETEARYPGFLEQYWAGGLERIPGGESRAEMRNRVLAGIAALVADQPADALVLAVTHGGVIREVEDHLGLDRAPIGNLCGRWVGWDTGELVAGEAFVFESP